MKLKYKKIIMLTVMSTMGIGLLTLSINHDNTRAEESLSPGASNETELLLANNDSSEVSELGSDELDTESTITTTPIPTATPIPTPTPIPVYDIEEEGYEEIDVLFKDYYAAKNVPDVDKLQSILSSPSEVETLEQLQSKTEYIDDYRNIKSYVKKGFEEGTYIVYVYHEIKFTSVNTPAPGLAKFYVITDEDGKPKIYSGEMDEKLKTYFDIRNNDTDVQELIQMTNDKSDEAKAMDEDLFNFWEGIDKMANGSKDTTTAEGDSEE